MVLADEPRARVHPPGKLQVRRVSTWLLRGEALLPSHLVHPALNVFVP